MTDDSPEAYYLPLGDGVFAPTVATESPWNHQAQHGGPPSALLAHVLRAHHPEPGYRIVRLTVEFLGPIPRSEVRVESRVLRPGRRVRLLEATLSAQDQPIALGRAWQIAASPQPTSAVVPTGDRVPALPPPQPQRYFAGLGRWGYGESIEWRWVHGGYSRPGPGSLWSRVRIPLVAGTPLHPLDRVLVLADSANGVSSVLPHDQWLFVPPSVTVTLHRDPVGDWVYLAAQTSLAADGIASTLGTLADADGPVGTVTQPLLVAPRTE